MNSKQIAWDKINSMYWMLGYNGGPSNSDINQITNGIRENHKIVIIGASTVNLIQKIIDIGCEDITIVDFSKKMIKSSKEYFNKAKIKFIHHDITKPVPSNLESKYDYLLADRLINRFIEEEAKNAFTHFCKLLKRGGEVRTTIRLGLYKRDLPLIEAGKKDGSVTKFYNEFSNVIDYGKASHLLETHLNRHGNIPKHILIEFYIKRGAEKRFSKSDIERYIDEMQADFCIYSISKLNENEEDHLFYIKKLGDS